MPPTFKLSPCVFLAAMLGLTSAAMAAPNPVNAPGSAAPAMQAPAPAAHSITQLTRIGDGFSLTSAGGYSYVTNTSRVIIRFDVEGTPSARQGCFWKYQIGKEGHPYQVMQDYSRSRGTAIPVRGVEVTAELMPGENRIRAIALDLPGNTCQGATPSRVFQVSGGPGSLPF